VYTCSSSPSYRSQSTKCTPKGLATFTSNLAALLTGHWVQSVHM
jgi:hypothetical protein